MRTFLSHKLSDYLQKDTKVDSSKARLGEDAEKAQERRHDDDDTTSTPRTEDPKLNEDIESEKIGRDPSRQRVISYEQLVENKKRTAPFRSHTETGELQQEVYPDDS